MEIVKTVTIESQFRSKTKAVSQFAKAIYSLKNGESLVISAKEADRWKVPANALRGIIHYAKTKKIIAKKAKFTVKHLKSGSYAVIKYVD